MEQHDDNLMTVLYREEKRSLEDLAAAFGCAVSTVRYRLMENGVEMRRRGRPRRALTYDPPEENQRCATSR